MYTEMIFRHCDMLKEMIVPEITYKMQFLFFLNLIRSPCFSVPFNPVLGRTHCWLKMRYEILNKKGKKNHNKLKK